MASSSGPSIVVALMSSDVRMVYASGRLHSRDHPAMTMGSLTLPRHRKPYLCVNVGDFILDPNDHRVEGLEAEPKEVCEHWRGKGALRVANTAGRDGIVACFAGKPWRTPAFTSHTAQSVTRTTRSRYFTTLSADMWELKMHNSYRRMKMNSGRSEGVTP